MIMKSEPKTDKAVTGEQGPEVTKVMEEAPVSSNITEQLTIAEMENVTTVFRSSVNATVTNSNQKSITDPNTSETFHWFVKLITLRLGILRQG